MPFGTFPYMVQELDMYLCIPYRLLCAKNLLVESTCQKDQCKTCLYKALPLNVSDMYSYTPVLHIL